MAKLFIFAIGGTGERVLRSFTMMLAAGVKTLSKYDIYPIMVDYDKENEDKKRTRELLENYHKIHTAAYHRRGDFFSTIEDEDSRKERIATNFFGAKLCNLDGLKTNYVFPFGPDEINKEEKFQENIDYNNLTNPKDATKRFLSSLYDESTSPDTELNLNMEQGFRGNPNVGSVVFKKIQRAVEFKNFKHAFNAASDKIMIIGSLFGGTGASGIPEIHKAIRTEVGDDAKIGALLVLPYFEPMLPNEGGAIVASRFNSKTKAALNFYEESGLKDKNGFNKIYYVGDPVATKIAYSEGGETQKNNANLVELIGAMMIEHFVADRGGNQKEFKFVLNANISDEDKEGYRGRLFSDDFKGCKDEEKDLLKDLLNFALAMKIFKVEVAGEKARDIYNFLIKRDGKNDADYKNIDNLISELSDFYIKYQEWLKELDFDGGEGHPELANSHRFALCDMAQYEISKNYSDILCRNEENKTDSKGKKSEIKSNNVQSAMNYLYNSKTRVDRITLEKGKYREYVLMQCIHSAVVANKGKFLDQINL